MFLSPDFISFCKEHEKDDTHSLILKANLYPDIDIHKAAQQIKGLQIAKNKLPSWYANPQVIYPKHLSLEQSSSEISAKYKQSICESGSLMIDLTGGLGVDTFFLSQNYKEAVYVEQQKELANIASHNFSSLEQEKITVVNTDAVEYLSTMNSADLIYIDPARRDQTGRKTVSIEDCVPNLLDIQDELIRKAKTILIKLSPMLDISLALSQLKQVSQIHTISIDNECKEILFLYKKNQTESPIQRYCVNIRKEMIEHFIYSLEEEENATIKYTSEVKDFLYEPNASLMKAGAYKLPAERYGLEKLHASSHLYTSSEMKEDFPGRIFRVEEVSTLNKKDIKKHFHSLEAANIATRNFPLKVDELRKRLNLKEGGDTYIFGTTLYDNKKILILCKKI